MLARAVISNARNNCHRLLGPSLLTSQHPGSHLLRPRSVHHTFSSPVVPVGLRQPRTIGIGCSIGLPQHLKELDGSVAGARYATSGSKRQAKVSDLEPSGPVVYAKKKKPRNPKEPPPVIPPCPERVFCAVVLGRIPQITPEAPPWAKEFYELQERKEKATRPEPPQEWWDQDDGRIEEEPELVIHPRRTQADEEGNRKSLERALDNYIYLLVKKKPAEEGDLEWGFPSVERNAGEAMRDCVMRTLHTHIGETPNTYPVGYFPMHFVDVGSGPALRRIFFFRVCLVHGPYLCNRQLVDDFVWATRAELKDYLGEGEMHAAAHDITDDI